VLSCFYHRESDCPEMIHASKSKQQAYILHILNSFNYNNWEREGAAFKAIFLDVSASVQHPNLHQLRHMNPERMLGELTLFCIAFMAQISGECFHLFLSLMVSLVVQNTSKIEKQASQEQKFKKYLKCAKNMYKMDNRLLSLMYSRGQKNCYNGVCCNKS
jgi:hypothetical protein